MRAPWSGLLLTAVLSTACGDELPTEPTNSPSSFAGTWRGNVTVTNVTAVMTWTLSQTGTSVSGPVVIALPTGMVLMNGTVGGTASGSSLTYTITVPPGGVITQPGCSGQISGASALSSATTMTGTYLVNSACNTGLTNGSFSLTRQ